MDAFSSCSSECDQRVILEGLISAFGSVFSLQEIESAYCKAGHNADVAVEILHGLKAHDAIQATEKSTHLKKNSKGSKPRKLSYSVGTVSSVMGRGYARSTLSTNDSCQTTKPLKLELEGPFNDEHQRDKMASGSGLRKGPINNKEVEEFLFSMLGDGFQLDMNVIQEVFGDCGYDVEKSMKKLLDISTTTLGNCRGVLDDATRIGSLKTKDFSKSDGATYTNGVESRSKDNNRHNLSREVLEALFNVPEKFDETKRSRHPVIVKRKRAIGTVVISPVIDTVDPSPFIVEPQEETGAGDVEDNYQILRRDAKQNWDAMKAYFREALDAFLKGDHARATYLLEEGKLFGKKAREADERSAQEILKTRNECVQNVLNLDLHEFHPKEALNVLKFHLQSLANIPSFQFLRLVLETNGEDITKGARKRLVMKFLAKESIKWVEEEGSPGTISIGMDEIDPQKLSVVKMREA